MAVVKANFVKRDKNERSKAKAHIKYIQHRQGKDGEKLSRTLFGNDGAMERIDAYRMIDEAQKGNIFFRFVISPDPVAEDQRGDLNMREITCGRDRCRAGGACKEGPALFSAGRAP